MIRLGLATIDPGGLRRSHGLRAVGAVASTYATLRWGVRAALDHHSSVQALFGMSVAFVATLVVLDPIPRDRGTTLAWSVPAVTAATLVAAVLGEHPWLAAGGMLTLVYLSFSARRWGARTGELALLATMSAYFAWNFDARRDEVGWYLLASLVGLGWLACWQFAIVPYRPRRSIERAVEALRLEVASLIGDAEAALPPHIDRAASGRLEHRRDRVHMARRVIQGQFAAVLDPRGWSVGRVERSRLALYDVDLGAEQVVAAVRGAQAADASSVTFARATARVDDGIRVLDDVRRELTTATAATAAARRAARRPEAAHRRIGVRRVRLRPTTALGVQAVVATGTAMGLAMVIDADHATWIFWSAFVVIAGSAGESVRRTIHRVGGTVGGAATGATLAAVLPRDSVIIAVVVAAALFAAVYFAPVAYAAVVFFLNVGFVVMVSSLETGTLHLVLDRSLTAAAGATIAAVVAVVVLPIRVADRYRAGVRSLLEQVDTTIDIVAAAATTPEAIPDARRSMHELEAEYDQVTELLPAAVFESNPMARSNGALAGHATRLSAMMAALRHLADVATGETFADDADRSWAIADARRAARDLAASVAPPPTLRTSFRTESLVT